MNWNRILAVIDKERADLWRNKLVLYTVILPPIIFIVIPVAMLVVSNSQPIAPGDVSDLIQRRPDLADLPARAVLQIFLLTQFVNYLLLIPAAVTSTIASYAIVGEKEQRTLEPLLATPITTSELLLGKSIAAAAPGILTAWLAFIVILITASIFGGPAVFAALATPAWIGLMLLVVPALTILAVGLSVIISSRVSDVRAAQQITAIMVLPIVLFSVAQVIGGIPVGILSTLIFFVIVAILDVAVITIGTRLFQRETILTRWK